jgi:hypothetical protein
VWHAIEAKLSFNGATRERWCEGERFFSFFFFSFIFTFENIPVKVGVFVYRQFAESKAKEKLFIMYVMKYVNLNRRSIKRQIK